MDGNTNRNSVCEGMDRPGVHIQNIRFGTVAAAYPGALAPPIARGDAWTCRAVRARRRSLLACSISSRSAGERASSRLAHLVGGASEGVDLGGDADGDVGSGADRDGGSRLVQFPNGTDTEARS
jgi:hypothetical protein